MIKLVTNTAKGVEGNEFNLLIESTDIMNQLQ